MARPWRLARSIEILRAEVNARWPDRSKVSDGTIADSAHSTTSDHYPWVVHQGVGIVRAIDITHDPRGGPDSRALAEHLRDLGRRGDPRVRYVISFARIASPTQNWAWRTYSGINAHRSHVHLSVSTVPAHFDSTAPWGLTAAPSEEDDMPLSDADVRKVVQALADPDGIFMKRMATAAKDRVLEALANPTGARAIAARQQVAREILYRTPANMHLPGRDPESVNLFTGVFRGVQRIVAVADALAEHVEEPDEPACEEPPADDPADGE